MTAPELLIPDNKKNKDWLESWIKYFSMADSNAYNDKFQDALAWDYFNNRIRPEDTYYLTRIGESELPAKVRRIPCQRPFLNRLSGQCYRRPFVFYPTLADKTSIKEKYIDNIKDYVDAITQQAEVTHYELSFQISQIKDKIQQLQQVAQKQPQNQQEAEQIQQVKQVMPRIIQNFQYASDMLQKQDVLTTQQIKKLEDYHRFEKKDWKEIVAQKTTLKLMDELHIKDEGLNAFVSGMVTGRKAMLVDYEPESRLPIFRSLDVIQLSYPKIESVKWIQDGPWVKLIEFISYPQLIVQYGKEFEEKYGKDKLEALKDSYPMGSSSGMIAGRNGEALFSNNNVYSGTEDNSYNFKVERCWWKVPRNIKVKYSPNPFEEGEYYRHFIQNKEILDAKDWKYSNGFYINKNNEKDVRNADEVEVINEGKKNGESYKDKYTNDLYYGVIINDEYILRAGKVSLVLRDIDRHGNINLPVFGRSYASITDQPYSLIWATKNLQDLYDIIHYHKELMLALSGTKTLLFDMIWKPASLTPEEWEMEKKKGVINIESVKEDGRKNMNGFNQFTMFDLSVSNSIGILDELCKSLEETMGDVMGIPRQMKGQTVETDQVGTYNAALKQGALINEIMFAEHDEFMCKAITHCVNLALTYCYKDGEVFGLNNTDLSGEIVNIPENILNNVRFKIIGANNTSEEQNMADMHAILSKGWDKQQVQLSELITLWDIKTTAELKQRAEIIANKNEEARQLALQAGRQFEQDNIRLQAQVESELMQPFKEHELKIKEFQVQVTKQLGEMNAQILSKKNEIAQMKVEADTNIKNKEVMLKKEAEDNVIALNDKHSTNDERIRLLEIEVNQLLERAHLAHDDKHGMLQHHREMEKIGVERQKVRMGGKNKDYVETNR